MAGEVRLVCLCLAHFLLAQYSYGSDCPANYYGVNCTLCHCAEMTECNKDTGHCGSTGCETGWQGPPLCQTEIYVIDSFYNDKVSSGLNTTFHCIVSTHGDPPTRSGIKLLKPASRKIEVKSRWVVHTNHSVEKTFEVDKVATGEKYTCQIRDQPGASRTITVNVIEMPRLSKAPKIKDGSVTPYSLTLSWKPFDQMSDIGDGPVAHYIIYEKTDGSFQYKTRIPSGNYCRQHVCDYQLTGLRPGVLYSYCLRSVRPETDGMSSEVGECSDSVSIKTNCTKPTKAIVIQSVSSELLSSDETKAKIKVQYKLPSSDTYMCDGILSVNTMISTTSSFSGYTQKATLPNPGDELHTVYFSKAEPNTEYYVKIVFLNKEKFQSPESIVTATSTPESKPSMPRNFKLTSISNSTVDVSWEKPKYERGFIRKYVLNYSEVIKFRKEEPREIVLSMPFSGELGYRFVYLKPNTKYRLKVQAVTVKTKNSDWSEITVETKQGSPGPPMELKNTSRTSVSVNLQWKPPIQLNGIVVKYKIVCKPENGLVFVERVKLADGRRKLNNVYQSTMTSLKPATLYECRVKASTVTYGPPSKIEFWTLSEVPSGILSPPDFIPEKNTGSTITLKLVPMKDMGKEGSYIVVVELMEKENFRNRRSLTSDDLVIRLQGHHSHNQTEYVTAELEVREVKDPHLEFVVGDGETYGGYYNAPLKPGELYTFVLCAGSTFDGVPLYKCSYMRETVSAEAYVGAAEESSESPVLGIILGFVFVAILVSIGGAYFVYTKKKKVPTATLR